jgi:hypothetical protein
MTTTDVSALQELESHEDPSGEHICPTISCWVYSSIGQ